MQLSTDLVAAILRDFRARMEERFIHVKLAEELMADLTAAAARYVDDPSRLVEEPPAPPSVRTPARPSADPMARVEAALQDDWGGWEE